MGSARPAIEDGEPYEDWLSRACQAPIHALMGALARRFSSARANTVMGRKEAMPAVDGGEEMGMRARRQSQSRAICPALVYSKGAVQDPIRNGWGPRP